MSDAGAVRDLRQKLETYRMRAILDVPLPRDEAGVPAFDATCKALAKQACKRFILETAVPVPLSRDQQLRSFTVWVSTALLPGPCVCTRMADSGAGNCRFLVHTAMTQRRYGEFDNPDAFKRSFERNQKIIALSEPILRKHRIRLGIENHKGWRSAGQAAWPKRVSSEWVGAHFDFASNVWLCEDPADTLR